MATAKKLTNAMRAGIIARAVDHAFSEREERYEAARVVCADTLYDHAFGETEKLAKKLPAGWCKERGDVYVSASCVSQYRNGENGRPAPYFKLSKPRLFPHSVGDAFKIGDENELFPYVQAIAKERAAIDAGKQELTDSLTSLLYSVHTVAKLREVWPEGERFFPADAPATSTGIVPHDLTLKLNRMLGL